MPRRYYLAPLVGDGTEDNPFRLSLADLPFEDGERVAHVYVNTIPWGLAILDRVNHTPARNKQGVDSMPDITLDSTLSVLTSQERNKVTNRLTQLGVDLSGITTSTSFRELLRRIGQHISPMFDENAL